MASNFNVYHRSIANSLLFLVASFSARFLSLLFIFGDFHIIFFVCPSRSILFEWCWFRFLLLSSFLIQFSNDFLVVVEFDTHKHQLWIKQPKKNPHNLLHKKPNNNNNNNNSLHNNKKKNNLIIINKYWFFFPLSLSLSLLFSFSFWISCGNATEYYEYYGNPPPHAPPPTLPLAPRPQWRVYDALCNRKCNRIARILSVCTVVHTTCSSSQQWGNIRCCVLYSN